MIKYFHELTKEEFKKLVGTITYKQLAKDYPGPPWCTHPDVTEGVMGCWSLMNHKVNRDFCKSCDLSRDYIKESK